MPHHARSIAQLGWNQGSVHVPAASRRGIRVTGVTVMGDALIYRAEGGLPPGIYAEDGAGGARMLLPDSSENLHITPVVAGPLLAVHRARTGRIPPLVEEIVFTFQGSEVLVVPGQCVGISGDGRVALVADVVGKTLHRVDLMHRHAAPVADMVGGMLPHLAPVMGLNRDGTQAVFMDARDERCDGSLEWLDLRSGERKQLLPPLEAPGRVCAAFSPNGRQLVVMEMRMAQGPDFRLSVLDGDAPLRQVLQLDLAQPLHAPAFVNEHVLAVPLALTAHEGTTYGALDLVAVDLRNGETRKLTQSGEVHGRVRVFDSAVMVEGGHGVISVPFARPQ